MITTFHSSIKTSRPFQFLYSQILQTSEQNSMAWDEIKFVWNWSYSPSFPTSSRICVYLPVGEYKELDLDSVNFSHFPWRFTWFINHVDICSLLVPMLVNIQDHTALLINLQCIIFVTAIITSYNLKNWSVQNICIWILSVNMGELHQICKEQVIFRKTICL